MRAWRIHDFGEPADVLRLEEVPEPNAAMLSGLRMGLGGWFPQGTPETYPGPYDEWALMKMSMAALALPDVTMARGYYPTPVPRPYTTGQEGVGMVLDAGPAYRHLIGKRVAACVIQPFGSLAPVAVGVGMVIEVDPSMSDEDAAAYAIPAFTGYHAVIRRGQVSAGEVVAVMGAAGGLGSACIQLARAQGATVIAVVGGTDAVDKIAHCRALGAEWTVDHTKSNIAQALRELTNGRGVDVIIDPVQGRGADDRRGGLRVGGRHVLCGHAGGLLPIDPHFYLFNHTLVGVTLGGYDREDMTRIFKETQRDLSRLIAQGRYRPTPTRTIAFDDVPHALTELANRRTTGRIVVRCSEA